MDRKWSFLFGSSNPYRGAQEACAARRLVLSAGAEHGGTPAPAPLPGLQPAPWESTVQLWAGKPSKTTR